MENQEINLAKINEQDWEKYRKMNKVASRPSTTEKVITIFYAIVAIGILVAIAYNLLQTSNRQAMIANIANYSANQFYASSHSQLLLNVNYSNPKGINNNTANALIATLQKSPKASATFAVATFFLDVFFTNMFIVIIITVVLVITYSMLFEWIPSLGTEPELPRRFKGLQRRISYVQKREEKLKKYGFTKREIAWYHAVRSELIKLELEYTL